MRASDITRLATAYGGDPDAPTPGPASALEVDLPLCRQLAEMILEDLTTAPPYGIAWWAPHPGTSRRILISDQLYACTESVSANMIESALHRLEFLDSSDQLSNRFANAVTMQSGRPVIKLPRPHSPLEELSLHTMRLHYVGCVRALAGALDCMAGTIIGVLALPIRILKADFNSVRTVLKRKVSSTATDGERIQAGFAAELDRVINSAGPDSWFEWTLQFRNMLVHRGRRIELGQYVPRTPVLLGPDGKPVLRVRVVTHLPRDPGLSDVEVFLEPSNTPILTEDAEQTLEGLIESTKSLIEGTARALTNVWNWRRAHPRELRQPPEQWRQGVSMHSIGFPGYAPGSFPYSPNMLSSHPVILKRLLAAALDDSSRHQWKAFD
jgi:hypothetical protein